MFALSCTQDRVSYCLPHYIFYSPFYSVSFINESRLVQKNKIQEEEEFLVVTNIHGKIFFSRYFVS